MASLANSKLMKPKNHPFFRLYSSGPIKRTARTPYEIPERYRNSFYLANAAFFDSTNWYLHKAYEVVAPALKKRLQEAETTRIYSDEEVADKVENIIGLLDQCNSILDVRFPIKRDDGLYEIVRGFRAHHGLGIGYMSCLGGLRINDNITRDDMKALSVLSTYKNACMGINMAGAHGGLKIRPKNYSPGELQNILAQYTIELIKKGYCNERDIAQPDINSSEQEMVWISKAYSNFTGQSLCAAVAGKTIEYGGIENYERMSSQGAFFALDFFLNNEELMKKVGLATGLSGKTFIIQGLGKLGSRLAELLVSNGAICVGVKEHDAYIFQGDGIDMKKLCEYRTKNGSIIGFSEYKPKTDDEIYKQQCDILVFAARQKSLNCYIARDVKAKVFLEAADGPITPTAHCTLTGRSYLVVPDIYACAGATVASYLEYLKNMQQLQGYDERVFRFSHGIYENILNRISGREGKMTVMGPVQRVDVDVPNVIVDSLECILSDVGRDLPSNIKLDPPICPLCQLPRPLVVQIYAPLENSIYHRTLYLFACINPNCWILSESWLCIRIQTDEKITDITAETATVPPKSSVTHWCADADDWDDNNANFNEENGNIINNTEKVSDEEEESCSLEDSVRSGFGNLNIDDRNANNGAHGGAVGRLHSPAATAEIEGNEGEVISIDTPTFPQRNIAALLQEVTPLPQDVCQNLQSDARRSSLIQFTPYFMSVWEETNTSPSVISDRHVKELLQEYQQKTEDITSSSSPDGGGAAAPDVDMAFEKYEKSNPAHGDKMFHHFLSKVQANSGQILRYSRESSPILLYPVQDHPKKCQYCQGELVFELQLVPTIISKLKLVTDPKPCSRLEFGTVLVYTCRKSCWSTDATLRIETIILQTENY